MEIRKYILLITFILSTGVFSERVNQCRLRIEIKNLNNQKGNILIGIYNKKSKNYIKEKPYKNAIIRASLDTYTYSLNCGKYVIAIIHDENNNKKLDSNMIGIPKEGYGFSNNPDSKFGPPEYEKAEINLIPGLNTLYINMLYLMD